MSKPLLFLLVLLVACAGDPAPGAPRVATPPVGSVTADTPEREDVAFMIRRDAEGVRVTVRFRGDASGKTSIALPDAWGGEVGLFGDLVGLTSETEGVTVSDGATPSKKFLTHAPGARVELAYRFAVTPDPKEIADGQTYRAQVHPSWFHFIGHALFVTPDWSDDERHAIRIVWEGMAPDAHVANSFGVDARDQRVTTTLAKLRHAVYVGGDFRVQEVDVKGKPVSIALRGTWGFTDEAFRDLVGAIVRAERDFFDDHSFDRFLITLIPTGPGCCSYGGTGLTDSFATFIASDLPIESRMKHLLAHELFHTWNGRKIQRQDPEELVYWFSEGFTDYYADVALLRSSLITFDEALANYNRVLRTYSLSSARNVPNEEIRRSFWNDRAVERVPYQRGNILAREWNAKIEKATANRASIDDVMRALLRDAISAGDVVSAAKIDALVSVHLPGGVRADIDAFIDKGQTIPVSPDSMGPCAKLSFEMIGPLDLGFDERAADEEGVLRGVRRDGPAYRAGARDGMKLLHSRYSGDSTKPAELTVASPGGKRLISYLPQGKKQPVPQFSVIADRLTELGARCYE